MFHAHREKFFQAGRSLSKALACSLIEKRLLRPSLSRETFERADKPGSSSGKLRAMWKKGKTQALYN